MSRGPLASRTCGVALLVSMLVGCSSSAVVIRKNGESVHAGRSISSHAYAWYFRGLHFERAGALELAREAFAAAVDADPKSGKAWAALLRVSCKGTASLATVTSLSREGLRAADRQAPVHIAYGECLLSRSESSKDALSQGEAALRLEPDSLSASLFIAQALTAAGHLTEAAQILRAAKLYGLPVPETEEPEGSLAHIDEALISGDLARAQSQSLTLCPPGALAARALALGQVELAKRQATLVSDADPRDPDARLVLALVSSEARAVSLMNSSQYLELTSGSEASAVTILLVARSLQREISREAAMALYEPYSADLESSRDPLVLFLREEFLNEEHSARTSQPEIRSN